MILRSSLALTVVAVLSGSTPASAQDARQLVKLPAPAEETLRQEMRDNLVALNEIVSLTVAGKVKEAGEAAEKKLGTSVMGQHRTKPLEARPGPHMTPAMHDIAKQQHQAASAFAAIAATGDREKALTALPTLSSACLGCHLAFRIR